jgi:citrate lyase beta subunit
MKTTLDPKSLRPVLSALKKANAKTLALYPGESAARQPVHTVYGGAHLYKADAGRKLGQLALKNLHQFAPEAAGFAEVLGVPAQFARTLYDRVVDKLGREAVEDFRIDFEDGYGNRPDEEEDHHAVGAADEVVKAVKDGSLTPFIGIRIKPLSNELHARSLRTLDLFVSTMVKHLKGLPPNFVVTIPKLGNPQQVAVLARTLELLEKKLKLPKGALKVELMIETTQSMFTPTGEAALLGLVEAGAGRVTGAHFGTYDYTASCSITAAHQHMMHPCCDFAKHMMQVNLAGTGVFLSDGATNVMPVGPHRAAPGGSLTSEEIHENVVAVHKAWKLHFDHVRNSLSTGYYQGWDLHPAQLPTRYAAVFSFFLEGLAPASARLKNFIEKAAQATLVGDVFDDAATGQGLLNYFIRGLNCGAITEEEAKAPGLTRDELQGRSFLKILEGRKKGK